MNADDEMGTGVALFRKALLNLIAVFDEADIPWETQDAYDGWDRVAEALYLSLVIDPLSTEEREISPGELPRYGFRYDEYGCFRFLPTIVLDDGLNNVFHSFETTLTPFDTIRFCGTDVVTGRFVRDGLVPWGVANKFRLIDRGFR